MEVLPSKYSWHISIICNECSEEVLFSNLPEDYDCTTATLVHMDDVIITKLGVIITSKEKILGYVRSQEWELIPYQNVHSDDGNYFNFEMIHKFNFGEFEQTTKYGLYLSINILNLSIRQNANYYAKISLLSETNHLENQNTIKNKLIRMGGDLFKLDLTNKIEEYLLMNQHPKIRICIIVQTYFCKDCMNLMKEDLEQKKINSFDLNPMICCRELKNPILQNSKIPEFTYTFKFGEKQNKNINFNYVNLVPYEDENSSNAENSRTVMLDDEFYKKLKEKISLHEDNIGNENPLQIPFVNPTFEYPYGYGNHYYGSGYYGGYHPYPIGDIQQSGLTNQDIPLEWTNTNEYGNSYGDNSGKTPNVEYTHGYGNNLMTHQSFDYDYSNNYVGWNNQEMYDCITQTEFQKLCNH
uniref:PSP domain-containing protein n=1 Tax=Meloidogyne hapla TaxID=6305 RepID=A0A1I8B351_MELHA